MTFYKCDRTRAFNSASKIALVTQAAPDHPHGPRPSHPRQGERGAPHVERPLTMDLLAQYSGSDDAGAGGDTDDDVATTAAMLRAKHAVPDLAPRVNDAGLAIAGEGDDARLVTMASTRDMHGTTPPRTAPNPPAAPAARSLPRR